MKIMFILTLIILGLFFIVKHWSFKKAFSFPFRKKIRIVPYNPSWPKIFEEEKEPIKQALGDNCIEVHHFGSTSIPGMSAKPKIDVLAVVIDLSSINLEKLEKLGFVSRGEVIPTGRYFTKKLMNHIHLHVFQKGNPLIQDNLLFRDYLRTHESDKQAYIKLKNELARQFCTEEALLFSDGKSSFVKEIIEKAKKS